MAVLLQFIMNVVINTSNIVFHRPCPAVIFNWVYSFFTTTHCVKNVTSYLTGLYSLKWICLMWKLWLNFKLKRPELLHSRTDSDETWLDLALMVDTTSILFCILFVYRKQQKQSKYSIGMRNESKKEENKRWVDLQRTVWGSFNTGANYLRNAEKERSYRAETQQTNLIETASSSGWKTVTVLVSSYFQ